MTASVRLGNWLCSAIVYGAGPGMLKAIVSRPGVLLVRAIASRSVVSANRTLVRPEPLPVVPSTARPGSPLPSKSPAAARPRELIEPVSTLTAGAYWPTPVLWATRANWVPVSVIATSARPSPLKSATATPWIEGFDGPTSMSKAGGGANVPPLFAMMRTKARVPSPDCAATPMSGTPSPVKSPTPIP